MNAKLVQEREKARQYLKEPSNKSSNFDWSDLRQENTQYFDRTPNKSNTQPQNSSPFEHQEISARSTAVQHGSSKSALDFDSIMKSSISAAVQNKYRESMANGRLSVMSSRIEERQQQQPQKTDFWSGAPSFSATLRGNAMSFSSEEFRPAEDMASQLEEDERMHDMEYAPIPRQTYTKGDVSREVSNWEESLTLNKNRNMSFGQYCEKNIAPFNIREIYGSKSPPKRQDRVALVELSTNNDTLMSESESSLINSMKIENFIKKDILEEKLVHNGRTSKVHREPKMSVDAHSFSHSISEIIEDLNFDRIMEKAKQESKRGQIGKENGERMSLVDDDSVPVQDESEYQLSRVDQNQTRGQKRRPTSACLETPLSALDKCHRSRSPVQKKELELAAARLKPQILPEDSKIFKVPLPSDSTLKGATSSSTLNREYLTAMESLSIRSPGEKLSLPNYALVRPTTKSPNSTNRSKLSPWSPNASEGRLKRSASQLSTGSEFQDDFLPIKIDNGENRKLSFPTVKVDRSDTKAFTIQNGSDKKLPLRVRVVGAGFSVMPKDEFRMVPLEARTFQVKFSPCVTGPAYGRLVFELSTNRMCSKTIPLYGYGGHSNVQINGVQKGPFGPSFITMGTIRELTTVVEKTLRLTNSGTLPSFASLIFERTKLSDFTMSESISVHPMQMKIDPGRSVEVKIRFKPTKSDIRKIVTTNKDVTTIGEIFIICGDEPTRLRVLMNKSRVDPKLLSCLPKSLPNEGDIQAKLAKFNEEMSRDKLSTIMAQIKTHEIALTINKNLDDTQLLPTELSLVDDTQMNFETFIDTNYTRAFTHDEGGGFGNADCNNVETLECKFFCLTPSTIVFDRSCDGPESFKYLIIECTSPFDLFYEVVPSNSKLVSVGRSCGKLRHAEEAHIKVMPSAICFGGVPSISNLFLTVIIKDARIEVPIRFV